MHPTIPSLVRYPKRECLPADNNLHFYGFKLTHCGQYYTRKLQDLSLLQVEILRILIKNLGEISEENSEKKSARHYLERCGISKPRSILIILKARCLVHGLKIGQNPNKFGHFQVEMDIRVKNRLVDVLVGVDFKGQTFGWG